MLMYNATWKLPQEKCNPLVVVLVMGHSYPTHCRAQTCNDVEHTDGVVLQLSGMKRFILQMLYSYKPAHKGTGLLWHDVETMSITILTIMDALNHNQMFCKHLSFSPVCKLQPLYHRKQ